MGESNLEWISSSGGPLVLLPQELVEKWSGIDPPADGRVIEVDARWNPDEPATDYDAACDVTEIIANVDVGDGRGIVLAGEPHPTAVWQDGSRYLLVRWASGESEDAVVRHLRDPAVDFTDGAPAMIEARPGPLVLFDAACPGTELEEDRLEIDVHPGAYLASAVTFAPDEGTSLILISLIRAD